MSERVERNQVPDHQIRGQCPTCQGPPPFSAVRGFEDSLLVRCWNCSMVFSERIPASAELAAYYSGYGRAYSPSETTLGRYRELLSHLAASTRVRRLLDFGCGNGHLLSVASELGWEVVGVDRGEAAREACRERGLDVIAASIAELEDTRDFDLVTAVEVVEHLPDPRAELEALASLIRPGGLLYVSTPNFDSLTRRLVGARWRIFSYPEHLGFFTTPTLTLLAEAVLLQPVEVFTEGLSPATLAGRLGKQAGDGPGNPLDEAMRAASESRRSAAVAKSAINAALRSTGWGDTIKGTFVKPD